MTKQEAKEIIDIKEITFDIEDTMFGDGSVAISIADVFDNKEDAETFLKALRILCH